MGFTYPGLYSLGSYDEETGTPVRVSQSVTELLWTPPPPGTRVTLLSVEVFRSLVVSTRATQFAVEIYTPHVIPTRATQQVVEYFQARSALTRYSQAAVEVFFAPGNCPDSSFPIDIITPGGSCPAPPAEAQEEDE